MVMIATGLIALGVILYIEFSSKAQLEQDRSAIPVQVDFPAPALDLINVDGKRVSLSEYKGQVVLINLWATWCPPCKAEMPALQDFYEGYKDQAFTIIGIANGEAADVVAPFVKDYGLTFPIWLDEDFQTERLFGTITLPTSWLVNRNGQVVLMWYGAISERMLEEYISPVIEE